MKYKLWNEKSITPACAYCSHGRHSPDRLSVLCPKRGVMLTDSSCRKFSYDPLKRQPQRAPKLQKFSAEEFEL